METRIACSSHLVRRGQCLILTPVAGSWGSLETDQLARLRDDLAEAVHRTEAVEVIVDLSTVTRGGSGLLHVLHQTRRGILKRDKRFAVCGDTKGLVRLAGWESLMNLHDDLWSVLSRKLPAPNPLARETPMPATTLLPVAT